MGRDKAFLKIEGEYFITRIFKKLEELSDKIIIVAGNHNYNKIKKLFPNQTVLLNADYELGQINSVKIA
jgi:molybdopterin-guanine dinucleotide biosynthesis protein A